MYVFTIPLFRRDSALCLSKRKRTAIMRCPYGIEKPCDLYLVGCICAYPICAPTVDAHCLDKTERETGIEPATFSLARRCSTTEPLPLVTIPLTGVLPLNREVEIWAMRDSNSHGSRQQILSLPCLPVSAIALVRVWEGVEFPHLWMIHQRLDYCQDNFLLLSI